MTTVTEADVEQGQNGQRSQPKARVAVYVTKGLLGVNRGNMTRWAKTILQQMEKMEAELSLALVSNKEIQELNRRYRGQDKPTDVLSFPLQDRLCPTLLGEVIISLDTAKWAKKNES